MVNQRCVAPRGRTKYTAEQLRTLEKLFTQSQYPDTNTLEELADKIDVTLDKVAIWFQNRRSKFKKQSKGGHVNWMRQQIFQNENVSQPDEGGRKNGNSDCHVLSAPPERTPKPKSNLHYLPTEGFNRENSSDGPLLESMRRGVLPGSCRGTVSINPYQVLSRGGSRDIHGVGESIPASVSQHFSSIGTLARTPSPRHLSTHAAAGMLAAPSSSLCTASPVSWYMPSPANMRTASPTSWHTPRPSNIPTSSRASLNTSPLADSMRIHPPASMRTPSPDQSSPACASFLGNLPQHPLLLCHLLNDMRQQEEARMGCSPSVSTPTSGGSDATMHRSLTPFTPYTPMHASSSAYSQQFSPWAYPPTPPYTPGLPPPNHGQYFPSSSPDLGRV